MPFAFDVNWKVVLGKKFSEGQKLEIPLIFWETVGAILDRCLDVEGIFRVPGSAARVRLLREAFKNSDVPNLSSEPAHNLCSLLMDYLRTSDPLLTYDLMDEFAAVGINQSLSDTQRTQQYGLLLSFISVKSHVCLYLLLHLMVEVARHCSRNLMTVDNLAKIVGPSVCRRRNSTPLSELQDVPAASLVFKDLVRLFNELFLKEAGGSSQANPANAPDSRSLQTARAKRELSIEERQERKQHLHMLSNLGNFYSVEKGKNSTNAPQDEAFVRISTSRRASCQLVQLKALSRSTPDLSEEKEELSNNNTSNSNTGCKADVFVDFDKTSVNSTTGASDESAPNGKLDESNPRVRIQRQRGHTAGASTMSRTSGALFESKAMMKEKSPSPSPARSPPHSPSPSSPNEFGNSDGEGLSKKPSGSLRGSRKGSTKSRSSKSSRPQMNISTPPDSPNQTSKITVLSDSKPAEKINESKDGSNIKKKGSEKSKESSNVMIQEGNGIGDRKGSSKTLDGSISGDKSGSSKTVEGNVSGSKREKKARKKEKKEDDEIKKNDGEEEALKRKKEEEELKLKEEEYQKKKKEEEEHKKRKEDEEMKKEEEIKKKKVEEEECRKLREEEELKKKEVEAAKKKKEEDDAKKKEEEAKKKKMEEEDANMKRKEGDLLNKKNGEEDVKKKKEVEELKKKKEDEEWKKKEEAELLKKKEEDEIKRKREEEFKKKKDEERRRRDEDDKKRAEEDRLKRLEEEKAKKLEEERRKKEMEDRLKREEELKEMEEERKKREEEAKAKKEEVEKIREETERKRKEEEERIRKEDVVKRKEEDEARKVIEEELEKMRSIDTRKSSGTGSSLLLKRMYGGNKK